MRFCDELTQLLVIYTSQFLGGPLCKFSFVDSQFKRKIQPRYLKGIRSTSDTLCTAHTLTLMRGARPLEGSNYYA